MAITINGAGTITGISAGGLPDGCVVADDLATDAVTTLKIDNGSVTDAKLASSLDLSSKTVTLPAGTGGKILQVATLAFTSRFSAASNNAWADVTGFKIDFTPQSASSTIIVQVSLGWSTGSSNTSAFKVIRDTTDVMVGDAVGVSPRAGWTNMGQNSFSSSHCYSSHWTGFESSPGTSQVEYQLQYRSQSGSTTTAINQSAGGDNINDSYGSTGSSSMVIWEVG